MSICFVKDDLVIAGGFDCRPIVFNLEGDRWSGPKEVQSGEEGKTESVVQGRIKMMAKALDGRKDRDVLITKHKNTINCIRPVDPTRYSTSDITGSLFIWKI